MRARATWVGALLLYISSPLALAQESPLHAQLRREGERVAEACGKFSFKAVPMCGYTLFTDHPLHIAAGSMPPLNGFGLGGAFVWAKNTKNWRMSWDLDAVGSTAGAWRAGGYMQMIHTPHEAKPAVVVLTPSPQATHEPEQKNKTERFTHPYTVFNFYAQAISLNKLNYFGLGNNTSLAGASVFGLSETIVGSNVIKPVFEWPAVRTLNLSLSAEVNGRFVSLREENGQSVPSIGNVYTNIAAPGLTSQPGFVQFGEGVRIKPVIGDHLQLNYFGTFQQYSAPSDSHYSFLRWTGDFGHTFYLYGYTDTARTSTAGIGPDECGTTSDKCAGASHTRNLNGSIGARLLISESINSASNAVPFYFQPTIGGQDINNALALGSYQDYRFRAPNILLIQGSFEHSIWGPIGLQFMADQGRVAATRGDLGFSHLRHSFAAGLTLRAGAFPLVYLMFAWGPEGNHNIVNMNTSLLGGSSRPSLY